MYSPEYWKKLIFLLENIRLQFFSFIVLPFPIGQKYSFPMPAQFQCTVAMRHSPNAAQSQCGTVPTRHSPNTAQSQCGTVSIRRWQKNIFLDEKPCSASIRVIPKKVLDRYMTSPKMSFYNDRTLCKNNVIPKKRVANIVRDFRFPQQ